MVGDGVRKVGYTQVFLNKIVFNSFWLRSSLGKIMLDRVESYSNFNLTVGDIKFPAERQRWAGEIAGMSAHRDYFISVLFYF